MKKIKLSVLLLLTMVTSMMFSTMVFATPSQVTGLKQIFDSTSSVGVEWTDVASASSYMVQYSSKSDFSSGVTTDTSNDSSYYFAGLSAGASYYVRVAAVDSTGTGAYSTAIEVVTSPSAAPSKIYESAATTSSATIKWSAVSGANAYRISVGGTYKKTITGTTYKYSGITYRTIDYVEVCPARVSATGYEAAYFSSSTLYATDIKVLPKKCSKPCIAKSLSYLSGVLTWNRIESADGYQVQVCTYAGKNSKKYTSTENEYLINLKNQFYKVRVRGYVTINGKKKYGAWSAYNQVCKQLNVSYKETFSGNNMIKASWSKVKGATSYSVYMSCDGANFKKITTTKKLNYTIKKYKGKKLIAEGKNYYIYVVANRKVGKKTYKSSVINNIYTYEGYSY